MMTMAGTTERLFRIMGDSSGYPPKRPPFGIPWGMIAPHEAQALANHDQSLETLDRRGGLDVCEAIAVLTDQSWREAWPDYSIMIGISKERQQWAYDRLHEMIAEYEAKEKGRAHPKTSAASEAKLIDLK